MEGRSPLRWCRWLVVAAALSLAATACAVDRDVPSSSTRSEQVTRASDAPVLTVSQASEQPAGSTVTVRGYIIATGGSTYLAEMLAETYPPQPGGSVLQLEGAEITALEGTESAGDTTWTTDQQVITGRVDAGVLHVR